MGNIELPKLGPLNFNFENLPGADRFSMMRLYLKKVDEAITVARNRKDDKALKQLLEAREFSVTSLKEAGACFECRGKGKIPTQMSKSLDGFRICKTCNGTGQKLK